MEPLDYRRPSSAHKNIGMIRDPGVVCQAVKTLVPIIYTRPICPVLYALLLALMS